MRLKRLSNRRAAHELCKAEAAPNHPQEPPYLGSECDQDIQSIVENRGPTSFLSGQAVPSPAFLTMPALPQ